MDTPEQIDFYFDFISPYGYLASLRIDQLAARHALPVVWHPVLLGVTVMKVMGLKPLMETPLKKDYIPREIARYARLHGVEIGRDLAKVPMNPLPVARVFSWLKVHGSEHAKGFASAALAAYWRDDRDLSQPAEVLAAGSRAGVPESLMSRALEADAASSLLREEVDRAIQRGVFGSPFFLVGDEPFFGVDKLELIDLWLARRGW
ncbi:MAG: 2-hydroxychromene-2-carboxylate isomerase [Betaproteobacteria bacterium]|nr:MAG: 2-hydroxychromene-2-carboxylate isomerase [Betaproteobacteria bacterium]